MKRMTLLGAATLVGALALAGCATTGGGGGGGSSSDTPTVGADGKLERLSDGFPNGPISIIVVDEAGSDDGIYATQIQQAAENYSPVPIKVVVRPDFGTYGSWEALGFMSGQAGGDDGRWMTVVTVPGSTTDLLSTPVAEDLGVGLDSLNFVALTESVPYVVVTRADAPWGDSFEDFLSYAKDNPNEVKYISRGPGAGPDMAMQQYISQEGISLDTSVGGSHAEINTAIGAGAGDVAVTLPGAAFPFVQDGKVVVLTCSGNANPCAGFDGVNNAASAVGLDNDPWGSNRGLFVTENVPDSHRAWLAALVEMVKDDEEFSSARGLIPGAGRIDLDHDGAVELQNSSYEIAKKILENLGLLDPSVK